MKEIRNKTIAIIGGGPAGSYLGYCLAKNGFHPMIFDDSHPREKPCGGGISSLAIEQFPILHNIPVPKASDNTMKFISTQGFEVTTSSDKESWAVSRRVMDKYLLDKAVETGCKHVKQHVIDVEKHENSWKIKTRQDEYRAKIIIGEIGRAHV